MTKVQKLLSGAALVALSFASPALAVNITGVFNFLTPGGANFFDPATGFVPSGFGNVAGPTVAIGPGVEFGFQDALNLDTADFTPTTLTITNVTSAIGSANFFMSFTSDTAGFFNNAALGADSFGGTLSVTGNTLTFAAPVVFVPGTRTATITFAGTGSAVPEPATWAMMLLGFGGLGYALRRRPETKARIRFA